MPAGSLIWLGELEEAERWLMEWEYALQSEVEPEPLTCNFSVELRGFEPLTPSMRTRCATGLRYSPENL
jgi:hypothetical protein